MKHSLFRFSIPAVIAALTGLTLIFNLFLSAPAFTAGIGGWTHTTPYPITAVSRNAVVHGDFIYVVGGKIPPSDDRTPTDAVYYARVGGDGTIGAWTATSRLPAPRYLHAVAATDTYLFAIAGWGGEDIRSEVYRAAFRAEGGLTGWETVGDFPNNVDIHGAAAIGNRIYVVGGWTGKTASKRTYVATVQGTRLSGWNRTANLPRGLYRHTLTAHNGTLYVTGGHDGVLESADLYFARPNADGTIDAWQQGTSLPETRFFHAAIMYAGRLVILGGRSGANELSSVYAGELGTDGDVISWSREPDLPESLNRFAAVSKMVNGTELAYIIGGFHGAAYRGSVYHSSANITPTPTATATATLTPTPPPEPTPDITITLSNDPRVWLAPGDVVTYTIQYRNEGEIAVDDVNVIDYVPEGTELVDGSVSSSSRAAGSSSGTQAGSEVTWTIGHLDRGEGDLVSFQVRRVTPRPPSVPPALRIEKRGPGAVAAGEPIVYTLAVTNSVPITLTNLVVEDSLPVGATYVTGGDGPPSSGTVTWTVGELRAESSLTVSYTVTANQTIANSDYRAHADGGVNAEGTTVVVTTVDGLPLIGSGDGVTIVNPYAMISWLADGTRPEMVSAQVQNPSMQQFHMPLIAR